MTSSLPLLNLNAPESLNFGGFDAHVLIIVKSVPSNFCQRGIFMKNIARIANAVQITLWL